MKTVKWKDLNHMGTPTQHAQAEREAREEYDRMGFAALRKAQKQTQVELAGKLGLPQASISAIENQTDVHLSTLRKYIQGLGGDVQIRAIFPHATFYLDETLGQAPSARRTATGSEKTRAKAVGQTRRVLARK